MPLRVDMDGKVFQGILYLGEAVMVPDQQLDLFSRSALYRVLAVVGGALCRVEVRLTF